MLCLGITPFFQPDDTQLEGNDDTNADGRFVQIGCLGYAALLQLLHDLGVGDCNVTFAADLNRILVYGQFVFSHRKISLSLARATARASYYGQSILRLPHYLLPFGLRKDAEDALMRPAAAHRTLREE